MGKLILLNLVTFMILCVLPQRRGKRQELGRREARRALAPEGAGRRGARAKAARSRPPEARERNRRRPGRARPPSGVRPARPEVFRASGAASDVLARFLQI